MKRYLFLFGVMLVVLAGCSKTEKETTFRLFGQWDPPPAYNGNPYAPGGVGQAGEYIYGKMALYKPLENDYKPYLAELWSLDDNKLTVKIIDDIVWEDGNPFTSDDIKTNFIINGGMSSFSNVWESLDSIETPDKHTIVFNLDNPGLGLVKNYILTEVIKTPSHVFGQYVPEALDLIDMRKNELDETEEFNEKYQKFRNEILDYKPEVPLGYGPYIVDKVTTSDMVLNKSDKFPGNELNQIDKIHLSKAVNNNVIWSQLKRGEIDLQGCAMPRDVAESILNDNKNLKMLLPSFPTVIALFMNTEFYPLNEVKFRQALAYIIDRKKVREIAAYYAEEVENMSGVLPRVQDLWIDTEPLNSYELNFQKAEDLLNELGFKKNNSGKWCDGEGKPFKFEIAVRSDYSDWVLVADEISRELTAFGIDTNVALVKNEIFSENAPKGKYPMVVDCSISALRHPYEGFKRLFEKESWVQKITQFNTAVKDNNGDDIDLDLLVEKLRETPDIEQQKEIVQKLAEATNTYLPVIEICMNRYNFFYTENGNITGWPDEKEMMNCLTADDFFMYTVTLMVDGTLKGSE